MIYAYISFVLILVSCGPSIKGETKDWDYKQKKIGDYMVEYPSYAKILSDKNEEWKKSWDIAMKVADKKEQAQALRDVNNSMTVVNLMMSYDRFEDSIHRRTEETQESILKNKNEYPDIANFEITFRSAAEGGLAAIPSAAVMVNRSPNNYEEAYSYFRGAVDKLQEAYKRIDGEYTKIRRYLLEQESKKEEKSDS